jgi:Tfp pilus assembly protein PilN
MSMLNLMPPGAKISIGFARRNGRLVHWTIGCLVIIIAMGATVVLGGFYIDNSKNNLSSSIDQTKSTIADQKLDKVQAQAQSLSGGVKLIVQVLSKEIQFSKLLQQLGALMPAGATLGNIQLSNKVNGALDLTANAIDYESATQVQVNLQDPKNNLFDKVDTISVSCSDATQSSSTGSGAVDSRYKCQIIVRALFKANASVTLLASQPAAPAGAKK